VEGEAEEDVESESGSDNAALLRVRPRRHGRRWPRGLSDLSAPLSMAQVEFIETLERLAGGWRVSV
jgi:hypothetical protein